MVFFSTFEKLKLSAPGSSRGPMDCNSTTLYKPSPHPDAVSGYSHTYAGWVAPVFFAPGWQGHSYNTTPLAEPRQNTFPHGIANAAYSGCRRGSNIMSSLTVGCEKRARGLSAAPWLRIGGNRSWMTVPSQLLQPTAATRLQDMKVINLVASVLLVGCRGTLLFFQNCVLTYPEITNLS